MSYNSKMSYKNKMSYKDKMSFNSKVSYYVFSGFNQSDAFSASSNLPLDFNQTGDSGTNKMPMSAKKGSMQHTKAR